MMVGFQLFCAQLAWVGLVTAAHRRLNYSLAAGWVPVESNLWRANMHAYKTLAIGSR